MTRAESSSWRPIPRRMLSRGGPRRKGAIIAAQAIATIAIAGAAAWLGWTLLRPLPTPPVAMAAALPELPVLEQPVTSMDLRRDTVAGLSNDNIFAHGRAFWEPTPVSQVAATTEPEAAQSPTQKASKGRDKPTPQKDVPDDVRKALEGLALKQIYTQRDGELIARISLLKSAEPEQTIPLRVNEEFKDPQNASGAWKLISIDRAANRVTLERSGHTVLLSVFTARPVEEPDEKPQAPTNAEPPLVAVVPEVQKRTRDEIVTELRAANVADADIAALIELLDKHPELVDASPAVRTESTAAPTSGRTPPPGLEGVLRMMGQQQKKAAGAKPAASGVPKP